MQIWYKNRKLHKEQITKRGIDIWKKTMIFTKTSRPFTLITLIFSRVDKISKNKLSQRFQHICLRIFMQWTPRNITCLLGRSKNANMISWCGTNMDFHVQPSKQSLEKVGFLSVIWNVIYDFFSGRFSAENAQVNLVFIFSVCKQAAKCIQTVWTADWMLNVYFFCYLQFYCIKTDRIQYYIK